MEHRETTFGRIGTTGRWWTFSRCRTLIWSCRSCRGAGATNGITRPGRCAKSSDLDAAQSAREDRDSIRTVSGRGYRFVAEIRTSPAEAAQSTPSSNLPTTVSGLIGREPEHEETSDIVAGVVDTVDASSSSRRPSRRLDWRLFVSGLARLLVASFSRVLHSRNQASPKIRSIAVLPLESLSSDPSQDTSLTA